MIWRNILISLTAIGLPNQTEARTLSTDCQECHSAEYKLWATSHHALAEQPVRLEAEQTAFAPVHWFKTGSITNQARIDGGQCQIVTRGFDTNIEAYNVDRVIGVEPVRQFLTATTNGRWQVHEASFDTKKEQWFDVYGDDDRQRGEWGHWTGRGMNWNSQCAECHNTRLQKNYDKAKDRYQTTMDEMGIGCGSCHSGLEGHLKWQRANRGSKTRDAAITKQTLTQILDNCGSCHSRRENLTGSFRPGDSFFDHYQFQILDEWDRWYADGQVHDEDYEFASFLSSKMYQRGVSCMDCHDPHSMKLRLPGNDLCMRCHTGGFPNAPIINPAGHSHHATGSLGNQCVNCHMPVTVYMQRHPRRDHGFTIPDSLLTKELNIPNACNRCHTDKSTDWAMQQTDKRYGHAMEHHTRERARWIAAAQQGDSKAFPHIVSVATNGQESTYWRAAAIGLLWQWADQAKTTLLSALKDSSPLVRARAVNSLESLVESNDVEAVRALKGMLEDPSRNVRVAAAWLMKGTLDQRSQAGQNLQAMLDFNADQPKGQYRTAMFELARQQPTNALSHLEKGIEWDPNSPPLRYEASEILNRLSRPAEAAKELQVLCRVRPQSADYRFKLGQSLVESHQIPAAIDAFQESVKLDPQNTKAWYNLGLALSATGPVDEAIDTLKRAETLSPNDPQIPYARASILARAKRNDEARAAANQSLRVQPDFQPAQHLLQTLPQPLP